MKSLTPQKLWAWAKGNSVCLCLVLFFAVLYVCTSLNPELYRALASMDLKYLNGEYYRWITAEWIHADIVHILFNSAGLICVGSLLTPFLGKWKTLLLFFVTATFAEIIFSQIVPHDTIVYIGGSSGGIFGLIGALILCQLRFPKAFPAKWYRLDVLLVAVFFVFANNTPDNFLTHLFGFFTGITVTYLMIVTGLIRENTK